MELRVPPLIQVLVLGFAMLSIAILLPSFEILVPAGSLVGSILIVVGAILAIAGVIEFRRINTTVDPRYPDNSESLVHTGIYKLSRNPMYLGMFIILLGWSLCLANVMSFVLLPVFIFYMNYFQIKPEERILSQKFGAEFDRYSSEVRRWI
jgi:protein-S-isoprenylcysteine O-methyltransferase Ste14